MYNRVSNLGTSSYMRAVLQDLRYGTRALRQNRTFSVPAVLALALGIGTTTAMFSVVDTVLLRSLPYPDADRLVWLATYFPSFHIETMLGPDFVEWRRQNRTFEHVTAYANDTALLTGGGEPLRIVTSPVTENFSPTFGVSPELGVSPEQGRWFTAEEDRPGGPNVSFNEYKADQEKKRKRAPPLPVPGCSTFGYDKWL